MAQFYSHKRRVTTTNTINVTAEDLDPLGNGVARHQGKTIFIAGLLPGEQAEIRLTEEKRHFAKGQIQQRVNSHSQRCPPRCRHFGVCGGCQQQHAAPALQHQYKSAWLMRLITRETGTTPHMEPVISGTEYGYRRRARLGLQYQQKQQRLLIGFRQHSANTLVDIQQCPVLWPTLEQLLPAVRQTLNALQGVKQLGHLELIQADNGPLMVLRHLAPLSDTDHQRLIALAEKEKITIYLAPDSDSLKMLSSNLLGNEPYYRLDQLHLYFNPRDFIQINPEVNQQMVQRALQWLDVQPQDRVLDLFCGMGNFTLPLAQRAKWVVGVEGVATLVARGQYNATVNALSNVQFFQSNLEDGIENQPWAAEGFDKVLLDPARAGAEGVMAHIVQLAPQRVVYVSCHPSTLVRDSKVLLMAGYQLTQVGMMDMFPHTSHLESMVLFIKTPT